MPIGDLKYPLNLCDATVSAFHWIVCLKSCAANANLPGSKRARSVSLLLCIFACHQWTKDSTPVMSCHEDDQLVATDLHLTSYSTLLLVPVLAANHLVLFSGSFPQNGSTEGTFPQQECHFVISVSGMDLDIVSYGSMCTSTGFVPWDSVLAFLRFQSSVCSPAISVCLAAMYSSSSSIAASWASSYSHFYNQNLLAFAV